MNGENAALRGCFFCKSGKEEEVAQRFEAVFVGGRAIAPTRTRYRRKAGVAIEERVALLPGYVFFELRANSIVESLIMGDSLTSSGEALELALRSFSRADSVLKLLRYSDGRWQLQGFDDQFAGMLFKTDGNIGVSRAYFDKGDRIRILEGFLKDYAGSIIRVNRKAKTVEINVDLQGKKVSMWLGYELVETVDPPARRV